MSLELINPNQAPPGGFRYRVPETGQWVPHNYPVDMIYSWNDLESSVLVHYKANRIAPPSNLRQVILEQLCAILPAGQCRDGNRIVGFIQGVVAEFQRVLQGTATLADWFVSDGGKRVALQETERRAAICAGCIFNHPPVGCSTCNLKSLNDITNRVVGTTRQPFDDKLHSCGVCGCSLSAKTRLPLDVLKRHITQKQMNQFPPAHNGWPGCWLLEDVA